MGGQSWQYFTPFTENISLALEKLREQEFKAGRYFFPSEKPSTIEQLINQFPEGGTQSILDIQKISDSPAFLTVSPFTKKQLKEWFGPNEPTRKSVEYKLADIFESLDDRGQGRYMVVFKDNKPDELFFAGYSID